MAGELEEKFALVTGGSSRIGLATAAVLLASDDASYMAGVEQFVDGDSGFVAVCDRPNDVFWAESSVSSKKNLGVR